MCKHCWGWDEAEHHKDFTQGAVGIEDFEDVIPYRHPKRRKKRKDKYPKTRPGCPENGWKKHVFVWVEMVHDPYSFRKDFFYEYYGYYKEEHEVCCGCGHIGKSRRTEKYNKINLRAYTKLYGDEFSVARGEPLSRYSRGRYKPSLAYFSYERNDPEFKATYKQWAIERGYPTWYYA